MENCLRCRESEGEAELEGQMCAAGGQDTMACGDGSDTSGPKRFQEKLQGGRRKKRGGKYGW